MLLYKILIWLGLALSAILVVENLVMRTPAFIFIAHSTTGMLAVICTLIGIGIGYGIKGLSETPENDDDLDF